MPRRAPTIEPLTTAFDRLFLQHPKITALLEEVRAAPEIFDRTKANTGRVVWPSWELQRLLEGSFDLQAAGLWPAIADVSLLARANGRSATGGLDIVTPDARRVLLAVADVFGKFISPIRSGLVSAKGHLKNGHLGEVSAGIWRKPHIWIDVFAGDIGEFEVADRREPEFIPRWSGIALESRLQVEETGKLPREKLAQQNVSTAVDALWPNVSGPVGVSAKIRDRQINDWLKQRGLGPVSAATIKRHLQSRRESGL